MQENEGKLTRLTFFVFAYWHDKRWKGFAGATVKIWDLSHNLARAGHRAVLFLPRYRFPRDNSLFGLVEVPFLNIPLLRSLSFDIALGFILLLFSIKERPDVIYVRRGIPLFPLLFSKLKRSVFVFEVNDDPYRNATWLSIKTDEIHLRACHVASVITEEIAQKIYERNPRVSKKKLLILPSGANIALFKPLDKRECQSNLGLDFSKEYVGFVGTLLKYQGIDVLIDATPYILTKHPSAFFLIIGEGTMKQRWIQKVSERGLEESFCFFGQVDYYDLPKYIGAMDVCVAPFLYTAGMSSPVKIFDYLACGRPVVASRIEGATDIFVGSGAVKLVTPENPKMLAKAIIKLLEDKEQAENMGRKGRAFVVTHYDREAIAAQIIRTVEDIHEKRA